MEERRDGEKRRATTQWQQKLWYRTHDTSTPLVQEGIKKLKIKGAQAFPPACSRGVSTEECICTPVQYIKDWVYSHTNLIIFYSKIWPTLISND
jgi:hypothetical protein